MAGQTQFAQDLDEPTYNRHLAHERHMFAWCLTNLGGLPQDAARASALSFYPYEAPSEPYRGLVFHDQAWHWAMLRVHGEGYSLNNPGSEKPSAAYEQESRLFAETFDA
jgi:hypothetical protein